MERLIRSLGGVLAGVHVSTIFSIYCTRAGQKNINNLPYAAHTSVLGAVSSCHLFLGHVDASKTLFLMFLKSDNYDEFEECAPPEQFKHLPRRISAALAADLLNDSDMAGVFIFWTIPPLCRYTLQTQNTDLSTHETSHTTTENAELKSLIPLSPPTHHKTPGHHSSVIGDRAPKPPPGRSRQPQHRVQRDRGNPIESADTALVPG